MNTWWLLSHCCYPQSLLLEFSCWMEEVNLTSSGITTMPGGHQRKCRLLASLLCSSVVYFTAQTTYAINIGFTHTHTHIQTHTHLTGLLCCRITEAFLCLFNACSKSFSWMTQLHLYRQLSLGSVSSINPSLSVSSDFHQPSSTRCHYCHLSLKTFISRCLSDG